MAKRGNPYHDRRGRFTHGGGTGGGGKTPTKAANQPQSTAKPVTEKRVPNKVVAAEQAKIDALKKQGLFPDVDKPVPHGKTVLLYHRTTPERAAGIAKEGFRGDRARNTPGLTESEKQHAYFIEPKTAGSWSGYGKAVVAVSVPRKSIKVDETMNTYYPAPMKVSYQDLAGRKARRVE